MIVEKIQKAFGHGGEGAALHEGNVFVQEQPGMFDGFDDEVLGEGFRLGSGHNGHGDVLFRPGDGAEFGGGDGENPGVDVGLMAHVGEEFRTAPGQAQGKVLQILQIQNLFVSPVGTFFVH